MKKRKIACQMASESRFESECTDDLIPFHCGDGKSPSDNGVSYFIRCRYHFLCVSPKNNPTEVSWDEYNAVIMLES